MFAMTGAKLSGRNELPSQQSEELLTRISGYPTSALCREPSLHVLLIQELGEGDGGIPCSPLSFYSSYILIVPTRKFSSSLHNI